MQDFICHCGQSRALTILCHCERQRGNLVRDCFSRPTTAGLLRNDKICYNRAMNQYFFILGLNSTLSVAEILAVLSQKSVIFSTIACSKSVLVIETENSLKPDFLDQLGGSIKFGQIIKETPEPKIDDFKEFLPKISQKINFGFSVYKLDDSILDKKLKLLSKNIYKLGLGLKNKLKEENASSRLVTSKEIQLSSVIVQKNKLLTQGIEFVLLVDEDNILLGQTLAVQKFEEYGFRDFQRPSRDILSGMLPPKVAKMMINLAQADTNKTLLDPFCGSGTILQEALLLGYKNIIGSDISDKAIENTNSNLNWLKEKFNVQNSTSNIIKSDVKKLLEKIKVESVDFIVTEPYLGPPLKGNEKKQQLEKVLQELSDLYIQAFVEFKKVLKPKSRVVIIFPIFKLKNQSLSLDILDILDKIKEIGFKTVDPIPEKSVNTSCVQVTENNSIIYSRPNQKILREIFIFEI